MDLLGQAGGLSCRLDVFVSAVLCTKGNVVANTSTEEKRLLRNKSNVLSQSFKGKIGDLSVVNQHRTFRGVINARNQADQRALTRTCGTNDRQASACGNPKIDSTEYFAACWITESQTSELDITMNRRDLFQIWSDAVIGDFRTLGKD